jgi:hypothetical protein
VNKIEHRLFSQISMNWHGRPLTSHEVIVQTIAATTRTGLTVAAKLDTSAYPTGTKISDRQMKDLEQRALRRHQPPGFSIGPLTGTGWWLRGLSCAFALAD